MTFHSKDSPLTMVQCFSLGAEAGKVEEEQLPRSLPCPRQHLQETDETYVELHISTAALFLFFFFFFSPSIFLNFFFSAHSQTHQTLLSDKTLTLKEFFHLSSTTHRS